MSDSAKKAAELMHKLIASGMFPALKLAMGKYVQDDSPANWMQVCKHAPEQVRALIMEGMEITLPPPDGYNAHDKPIWNSSSLAKHFSVDHSEIEQFIKANGMEAECSMNQIIGLVN